MTNEQLFIMLFAALAVAAMLYLNVQKITRRIDESTARYVMDMQEEGKNAVSDRD